MTVLLLSICALSTLAAQAPRLVLESFDDVAMMDAELNGLAGVLAASNPAAMAAMKTVFWQGTEGWDALLAERARLSGTLVLSESTRAAIAKFKGK